MLGRLLVFALFFFSFVASANAEGAKEQVRSLLVAQGWRLAILPDDFASKSEVDRAKKLAKQLSDVFLPGNAGTVKHLQSGLECPSNLATNWSLNELQVVPPNGSRKLGEDVVCLYRRGTVEDSAISLHLSAAIFPNAEQSLEFTVASLAKVSGWLGWAINLAPPEFSGQNVAMARGNVIVGQYPNGVMRASDVWISARPAGERFWEIKLRPVGDAAYRGEYDKAALQVIQDIGQFTPKPGAVVQAADGGDRFELVDKLHPETSALLHRRSGYRCPVPPINFVRKSLDFTANDEVIQCRYASVNQMWSLLISPAGDAKTSLQSLEAAKARYAGADVKWSDEKEVTISNRAGRRAKAHVVLPNTPGGGQWSEHVFVTEGDKALYLNTWSSVEAALPTQAELMAFVAMSLPQ